MSSSPQVALQLALTNRLFFYTPLTQLLPNRNMGATPYADANLYLPYVLIADVVSRPLGTQTHIAHECDVTCEVYSTSPGGGEARRLLERVADAFEASLAVAGQRVILQQGNIAQVVLMSDGKTYRGTYRLRIILEDEGV